MTRSQTVATDIAALLRARTPLLWIVTREEARVERHLFEAARAANYVPRTWDVGQGVADLAGVPQPSMGDVDPGGMLNAITQRARQTTERGAWIMRDLPVWLAGPSGAATLRQLRNLARMLPGIPRERAQAVIVLSPSGDVPPELAGHATVIDWPAPDREEIAAILDAAIAGMPEDMQANAAPNGARDAAIDAAVGLSGEEASNCYSRSLVQTRTVDPAMVSKEKKRVIARERVLEWFDPLAGGLDSVGGLDVLKTWLRTRSTAYSAKARAYGLPMPKGCLLVGIPGCGKSLTAKAIATAWSVPLLRVDLGGLKSKYVGESEANLRKAFQVIESVGRCVVWFDEIEKALGGSASGAAADGGVSSDALGAILSWMQDRTSEAFVIATANDVTALPPELLRKGRFDEIWAIDLPTRRERVEILRTTLRQHGRGAIDIDEEGVAMECESFTGSEVAALVPDALFAAFADGEREIETRDLLAAAATIVPLAVTQAEKIEKLRTWAKGRARYATAQDTQAGASATRALDI